MKEKIERLKKEKNAVILTHYYAPAEAQEIADYVGHYQAGEVDLICKQDGVIAGLEVFKRVFELLDPATEVAFTCKDGDTIKKGEKIGLVRGDIRVLLSGERTALNYLQRMSCIATPYCKSQLRGNLRSDRGRALQEKLYRSRKLIKKYKGRLPIKWRAFFSQYKGDQMNFFNLFFRKDINEGIERYLKEENAVLLDVRTNEEYVAGHIEGSINLPIGEIYRAGTVITDLVK